MPGFPGRVDLENGAAYISQGLCSLARRHADIDMYLWKVLESHALGASAVSSVDDPRDHKLWSYSAPHTSLLKLLKGAGKVMLEDILNRWIRKGREEQSFQVRNCWRHRAHLVLRRTGGDDGVCKHLRGYHKDQKVGQSRVS
jgi:hypothetical protein